MRTPNPTVARRGRLAATIVGAAAIILALAGPAVRGTAVVPAAGPPVTARPDGPRLSAEDQCREREFEITDSYYGSAEFLMPGDNKGMLRARATSVGPWELFFLEKHPWNVTSPQYWRGLYTIRSYQNGKYVAHEPTYPGDTWNMLRARSDVAGEWEAFYLWLEDW